ncbi:hypothetical protein [Pseudoalteromonas piscicida]|uniref:Uncharacterized protein n=1 Tax=Pseudoalteromonas piscicida TaxID=43662 RepID=A0A2A5JNR0_PSEO7|nr:hypothetical protein [Pseudoalteromonas piscicida]PCK31048.1 hypothetical protein CEX98_14310 [Pseudoalteromonas piscicida]
MMNIRQKIVFCLTFLSFGCASIGGVQSQSIVARGIEELSSYDGQSKDINEIRVDGLPLFIALSLNGINETSLREYEHKGGEYDFPGYLLNALCERGRFEEALYFIYEKKVNVSSPKLNGNKGSCLLTAINKQNSKAFEKFLVVARASSNSKKFDEEVILFLEDRIQTLRSFTNE